MKYITSWRLYSLILLLAVSAGNVHAAVIGNSLQQAIEQQDGPHEVIVTFTDMTSVSTLDALGIVSIKLTTLPMAGAILGENQIDMLSGMDNVASIYLNRQLEYSNFTSGEITGGHYVHDNYGIKGAGVTIAILDSGIDASHPDLALGSNVVQNVKIIGDLGLTGGTNVFLENQLNTDTSSGHGTHVAGTAGGTGAASASDSRRANYYDGIAPESSLIGLGTGEALFILHALLGFDYVIANQERYGIDIISNSWGGGDGNEFDPNNPINQASYEAYQRGMVVTFAASNSGPDDDTLNQYAIAPWVINVAAGTSDRQLADFSSRGVAGDDIKHPDITAPGNSITSTRAVGTPIGALGPVVDLMHPEYYVYYHTISGTSMATPFVSGTVALLLEANPELSPDQVEDILIQTADTMPGYEFHEVGAGYINARSAVELANSTTGTRTSFLSGDTRWSSQGEWNTIADADQRLAYDDKWREKDNDLATDDTYRLTKARHGGVMRARFLGSGVKLVYPTDRQGGIAELFMDGTYRKTVGFFSNEPGWGNSIAITDLDDGLHVFELRAVKDNSYIDGLLIDGELFAENVQFVEESETFTDTMGPSVENLEVDEFPFEVDSDVTTIGAELDWNETAIDLDLYLVDPDGNTVASGATLAKPESLVYSAKMPGTYRYRVTGYISVFAEYQLTSTLTRAVTMQ